MLPFEPPQLRAVAAALGPRHGPMVLFAATTGLRPGEWLALEWRDIDLDARVVHVRRAFRIDRVKTPKTNTPRTVPLQRAALDAWTSPRAPSWLPRLRKPRKSGRFPESPLPDSNRRPLPYHPLRGRLIDGSHGERDGTSRTLWRIAGRAPPQEDILRPGPGCDRANVAG
jgi:integrase